MIETNKGYNDIVKPHVYLNDAIPTNNNTQKAAELAHTKIEIANSNEKPLLFALKQNVASSEKLVSLQNNPFVKSGTEKILNVALGNGLINKFFLDQDVFKNKLTSSYLDSIVIKYPEIRSFVYMDLGMTSLRTKKYEQLNASEKIKLNVLNKTLKNLDSKFYFNKIKNGKTDISWLKNNYEAETKSLFNKLSLDFQGNQIAGFGDIQKTLINTYDFSKKEIEFYMTYLEYLKNQPKNIQEASGPSGYLFVALSSLLAGALLGAMGMKYYHDLTHPESETIIHSGRVEIGAPTTIAKLLSVEAPFTTTGTLKKELFKVNNDDNPIFQALKKAVNVSQNSEIIMQVDGKYSVSFDLNNSTFEYDYTTKKIYVHLKSPEIIITDFVPKILKKNGEIFEMDSFQDIQSELLTTLKNNVMQDANKRADILDKARINTGNTLMGLYQNALSMGNLQLLGVEVVIDQSTSQLSDR